LQERDKLTRKRPLTIRDAKDIQGVTPVAPFGLHVSHFDNQVAILMLLQTIKTLNRGKRPTRKERNAEAVARREAAKGSLENSSL
jgi:hypothetical protein